MTPIEKAAHEAAKSFFYSHNSGEPDAIKKLTKIITKHLAPVQAELDAKDAENKALRQIISDSVKALKSGVVAPDASLEFMQEVPKEIGLVTDGKDKLLQEANKLIKSLTVHLKALDEAEYYRVHSEARDWLARLSKNE